MLNKENVQLCDGITVCIGTLVTDSYTWLISKILLCQMNFTCWHLMHEFVIACYATLHLDTLSKLCYYALLMCYTPVCFTFLKCYISIVSVCGCITKLGPVLHSQSNIFNSALSLSACNYFQFKCLLNGALILEAIIATTCEN